MPAGFYARCSRLRFGGGRTTYSARRCAKERLKQSEAILLIENDESDVFFFRRALSSCHFPGVVRVVGTAWQARDYMEGRGKFSDRSYFPLPNLSYAIFIFPAQVALI